MISITFPDGKSESFKSGVTSYEVALSISEGLARNILVSKVNGRLVDINAEINNDASVEFYTWNDKEGKEVFWHSSAHLLAEAVQVLYPKAKFGIGPAVDNGFYYDIDFGDNKISSEDFLSIETKMTELSRQKNIFHRQEISKKEAVEYFTERNDIYKVELLQDLKDGDITFYKQGNFTDLCRGPHIPDTGKIKSIKLLNVAGAYWKGDETNNQLTRIYGISFPKRKELQEYLEMLEEAKKRDHRIIGKKMNLFTFSSKVGQGLPLWLPAGAELRERLENFLKKAQKNAGYEMVISPHIGNKKLYEISGHYEKYGESSFHPIKTPNIDEEFLLKPMNCPHHCEIYNSQQWSYRDLPKRYAEFGTVYRYEQSGELHGLTRVRGFTQDDAHIFCTEDQLVQEFKNVIDLVLHVFKSLGFEDFTAQISLRDKENKEKYIGSDKIWKIAEDAIIEATEEKELNYRIEYGEAAFYGPKLDFMVKDALNREWQLGTIQVDYNLPERFNLSYKNQNNELVRPVMIHRAPFGSLERFIAILIEHTGGIFPLWLASNQIKLIAVGDKHKNYTQKVSNLLEKSEIRATSDLRNETVGKKIREAEKSKIPFMGIIGDKEVNNQTISIRAKGGGEFGEMDIKKLINFIREEELKSYN